MVEALQEIERRALAAVASAVDADALESVRVGVLGKKGELTTILRSLGAVPAQERPALGKAVNDARARIETALAERKAAHEAARTQALLTAQAIDPTLPGRRPRFGHLHPLTLVRRQFEEIMIGLGFEVVFGPEIETDYYNFEALNVPKDHPARDMQDTFYVTDDVVLRTQTSSVQIRTMENRRPPLRIIAPGRVYRVDDIDATHSPMFNQIEGLAIDRRLTFGDLKGTLGLFARRMFGESREVRFRPSYFPFTEPSAEMDISCGLCGGAGCRSCGGEGWLEVLGCGMVHPRVLQMVGYDPEEVGGFAFGVGIERMAMLKYGLDEIRVLFENDQRFLAQF
ncbi:MAG TPA: phenylalanine--tRNA ligase subunit alpha [Limnochordia bacterium]|nr:phenylalanine--tRNA ligase subunit alpha [Limnochordia bacterium]